MEWDFFAIELSPSYWDHLSLLKNLVFHNELICQSSTIDPRHNSFFTPPLRKKTHTQTANKDDIRNKQKIVSKLLMFVGTRKK